MVCTGNSQLRGLLLLGYLVIVLVSQSGGLEYSNTHKSHDYFVAGGVSPQSVYENIFVRTQELN